MSNDRMPFNRIKGFKDMEITLNPTIETMEYLDRERERARNIDKIIIETAREIGQALEGIALDIAIDELIKNPKHLKDFLKRMNERTERARESERNAVNRSLKNIDEKYIYLKEAHAYRSALLEVKWITESGLYSKRRAMKMIKETVNTALMRQEDES